MNFKPVVVASFETSVEAHLARTKLESEGIPCYLTDENIVTMNWLYTQAVGGIRLITDEHNAEQALKILKSMNVGTSSAENICPRCGAQMHITLASFLLNILGVIISCGLIIILAKKPLLHYRCSNCKYSA